MWTSYDHILAPLVVCGTIHIYAIFVYIVLLESSFLCLDQGNQRLLILALT